MRRADNRRLPLAGAAPSDLALFLTSRMTVSFPSLSPDPELAFPSGRIFAKP
jgi:hypothetical protein